jgi:hypothetical protein
VNRKAQKGKKQKGSVGETLPFIRCFVTSGVN